VPKKSKPSKESAGFGLGGNGSAFGGGGGLVDTGAAEAALGGPGAATGPEGGSSPKRSMLTAWRLLGGGAT